MKKTTLCLALMLLFASAKVLSQQSVQQLDSIFSSMYAKDQFHGNVLVAKKGNVIYKKSFGLSNETTKEKLDENSVFELASVSKQFTAMGIVVLAEKGKLKYEDKLSSFFPELAFYESVTIHNLLTHTGGLPDYMDLLDKEWDKSKIATNKDVIAALAKHKPKALFAPGEKFEYSNTGYALLASVIEKVSGMSFPDFMAQNIFKPLKMDRTSVYTRRYNPREIKNYAYGYVTPPDTKTKALPDDVPELDVVIWLDGIMGDGTVNSTVNDLLKWDRALYTDKLVSKKASDKVFSSGVLNSGVETQYGFGWLIENTDNYGKIVWHNGGWPGYITHIERHLDNDVTIVMLQNAYDVDIPNVLVRRAVYGQPLKAPERKEIQLSENELRRFVGDYELAAGYNMSIT